MEETGDLRSKTKARLAKQESKVKILQIISYNRIQEKMPETTRKNMAYEAFVEYMGEETTVITEMEILSDIESEFANLNGRWEVLQETRWILMSILGYDRELAKLVTM
jgi:hypothetical protein